MEQARGSSRKSNAFREEQMKHNCPECGLVLDRDLNAARNILQLTQNNLECRSVPKNTEVSHSESHTRIRINAI